MAGAFILWFPRLQKGHDSSCFPEGGMIDCLMTQLKRSVRYLIAFGPSCLNMMGDRLSGPIDFEHLLF